MASLFALLLFISSLFLSSATASPSSSPQDPDPTALDYDYPDLTDSSALTVNLMDLGFQLLGIDMPSGLSGPLTAFAPSDDSIASCYDRSSCSIRLVAEHVVRGHFNLSCLSDLACGVKLHTAALGRCLTVTRSRSNGSSSMIYINGVEITRPNLHTGSRIVIHGIADVIAPLSPLSCYPDPTLQISTQCPDADGALRYRSDSLAREALIQAISRLGHGGCSVLAHRMILKFPELAGLRKLTVFAVGDGSAVKENLTVTELMFHVVPNRLLRGDDLANLPNGTVVPTLVHGHGLMITRPVLSGMRINGVALTAVDLVADGSIAVHRVEAVLPHLVSEATPVETASCADLKDNEL